MCRREIRDKNIRAEIKLCERERERAKNCARRKRKSRAKCENKRKREDGCRREIKNKNRREDFKRKSERGRVLTVSKMELSETCLTH